MQDATFLFTDIEGSTRLWEDDPGRMRVALARHDELARAAVEEHRGRVVKMTGDGLHAVFADERDAVCAAVALQQGVASPDSFAGLALRIRCGIHAGPSEGRDGDFYGTVVNRAARIMSVAHGGQMLLSEAVARGLDGRIPEGLALRDLGLVRLRDLSQPERVFQLVSPGLRAEFPALRSLAETPNNLPHQLTSFIGREREALHVRALLGRSRLVTLLGMGGIGKTRLALQAAADAIDRFQDGVWLVELAPIADAERVPQALAVALGVREEPGGSVMEALLRFVKTRSLLVVLDNCEHVLAATAELARRLLEAGPAAVVLATSRQPLQVAGEATYPLAALPVPGPLAAWDAQAVGRYESVQLFGERARAVRHDFTVDAENAAAVTAICNRLDGIPLALELAAARVRAMPVADIAARLKDRFRILTSSDPTALPRQRTLRAMIDWSHDLLPDDERVLFRRLAAFAGGWTLASAEEVCADATLPSDAILDVLARLVEKSLVLRIGDGGRYALLETVREYAQQRLADADEGDRIAAAHAAHFVRLAVEARDALGGERRGEWIARLGAEGDNLMLAHAALLRAADGGEPAMTLADALKMYWAQAGLLELGHRVTAEALAHPGARARTALRSAALFNLGQFRFFMGRYAEARQPLEEGIAIARELGDEQVLIRALQTLGVVAIGVGDFDGARPCLEEAVVLAEGAGDARRLAGALVALGASLRMTGDWSRARAIYERVVALAANAQDREAESVACLNVAIVCIELGDHACAVAALARAMALERELGNVNTSQSLLEVCSGLAAELGEPAGAARFFGAAEALALRTGVRRDPADERFLAPRVARTRERLGEATFAAERRAGEGLPTPVALDAAASWLGAALAPAATEA